MIDSSARIHETAIVEDGVSIGAGVTVGPWTYIGKEVEVGETYLGRVTHLMKFGAFVEILPGKEGLVHVSQLALQRVEKPEDIVHEGDEIMVKVTEIDDKGRINLSRKALLLEKKNK